VLSAVSPSGAVHKLLKRQGKDLAGRDPDLPATIDRYECLRKIATGGMAELFLAKQSGLEGFEKVVVLKRILHNLAMDEEFVSMFLNEARIAAKLSHPNIVQIYDLGKADESYYIAMEYISGRNVQEVIEKEAQRGGLIPVEHVCRIVAGVCDGLFYAHTRKDYDGENLNIVHRDISPQNILVSFAGGVKVVDFGIAKASTQLAQTRAGVLKGKYAYMSPEQVKGSKIDARSDIFAVGLVMYEMLTGRRAFERESSLKTLKAIVQEKPLNPREVNPDVPMEVVKLLSKALEKSPDRRYKDAQEMQLALEDYLDSSPKKSNNIRISRYLYEVFDDELNSKSGTMVVEGVGEVIVPTGARDGPLEPRIEEEIDSKTLSAALAPGAPEPKADPAGAAPDPNAMYADLMEDDDSEEEDDKTIPVFDLEKYEAERAAQHARGGDDDSDDSEDPTMAGVSMADISSRTSPAVGPSVGATDDYDDEDKTTAGIEPAQLPSLASVTAGAPGGPPVPGPSIPSGPPTTPPGPPLPTSQPPASWEAATNEMGADVSSGSDGGIRPAATPGIRPAASATSTPPLPVPGPSGPVPGMGAEEVVPGLSPATSLPAPPVAEPVTPSVAQPSAAVEDDDDDDDDEGGGIPIAALLGVAAIMFMMFMAVVGAVVVFFVLDDEPAASQVLPQLTVQVDSVPQQATVTIDGEAKGKTPLILQMKRGAQHKVELSLEGYTSASTELDLDTQESFKLLKETLTKAE